MSNRTTDRTSRSKPCTAGAQRSSRWSRVPQLALAILATTLTTTMASVASAGEIKELSAVAVRPLFKHVTAQFERASGHTLTFQFVTGPNVQREIEAGATFDVAVTNPGVVEALGKQGRIVAATQASFARAGVGVCSRAGAAKPDISTVDAFRRALLNASSVSYSAEGTSGAYFLSLLDRLRITTDMKDKLRPQAGGTIPDAVAKGEAELCVTVMSQLVPIVAGAQLVGSVPAELQTYIGFTAGIGTKATDHAAALSFIAFLKGPEVATVLGSYGLEAFAP